MIGARDRQRAARHRLLAGGGHVGILELGEDAPAGRGIAFARFAQFDRSRRPVQQLRADPLLQKGDGAADGGG